MAVNAYLAIKSLERKESPVFSYLDANSLKLCIDQGNGPPRKQAISEKLRLEDLFELHTKKLRLTSKKTEPILPDLVSCLARFSKEWNTWRNRQENKGILEKNRSQPACVESLPLELIEAFQKEQLLSDDKKLSLDKIQEKCSFKSLKETSDWLVGKWLEDFVLLKISSIAEEFGASFVVPLVKSQFEFDVAFMKGYQLFAFSCTTSSTPNRCKGKLFEAYIRARQLGGEEARVALVCCSDEPEVLKSQFKTSIADQAINVFGCDQLVELTQEIEEWIQELDRRK